MSDDSGLSITEADDVLRITLNRPERRNAQTPAMWRRLADCARALGPHVTAVLIDAEGPSFSAGLDRRMLAEGGIPGEPTFAQIAAMPQPQEWIEDIQAGFTAWREVPAIVVCAVQGHAVGAGFQLALAADVIVAADDAAFSMRETSLGLVPDLGGTHPLVAAVGYPRALEICLTGRAVSASEALTLGIVARVVPPADLAAAAEQIVTAARTAPLGAGTALKHLLRGAHGRTPREQAARERDAQAERLRTLVRALGGSS